jgi:hypothetical protein
MDCLGTDAVLFLFQFFKAQADRVADHNKIGEGHT